ncbi:MAG: LLM class flavin-dependent oxidoreductase [Candidatus Tectomicrobia bacterium]|uniref:LLM class flavin-dependent oxidoreductase n=1 Tax=Tectimicrobiota bacterium TaxID=2528274 RepID=A0A932GNT3_UNCTE|nr:LLM class flavin-dependent oxidoreductase [Candidatus Tectomicrobia bacterium]
MQFGISIPQIFFDRPCVDTAKLQGFLRRAEELGFHSAWTQEQILGRGASCLEPISLLSYAAAVTRTLRLGVSVLITPVRSPVQLAKSLATLDQLSDGRLIAGVGIGASTQQYPAFGISAERRVRRFSEGLKLMKLLWTEERVTFDSEFWKLDNAQMNPKPVQKPHPPLWFGGAHPAALKRAVELGDGWMGAGSSSTDGFVERVPQVRGFLAEAKRDLSTFAIAKRVYLAVDSNKTRAIERLREWSQWHYGKADLVDHVAIWGDPQEIIAELRKIRAAGAELILLNPVFDAMDHMEILAREIVPALRG